MTFFDVFFFVVLGGLVGLLARPREESPHEPSRNSSSFGPPPWVKKRLMDESSNPESEEWIAAHRQKIREFRPISVRDFFSLNWSR